MENIDNRTFEIYNGLAGLGYFMLDPGAVMGYHKKRTDVHKTEGTIWQAITVKSLIL